MAAAVAYCSSAVLSACPYRPLPPPRSSSSSFSWPPSSKLEAGRWASAATAAALLVAAAGQAMAAEPAHAFLIPAPAALLPILPEPENALSLPTWVVHVSSVIEWITAMALVWEYGEKSGFQAWKGLSWGMVPLLGGAMCACTWHFFYNSETLEILVAIQGALTVVGNMTMAIAAFRIFKASQEGSKRS